MENQDNSLTQINDHLININDSLENQTDEQQKNDTREKIQKTDTNKTEFKSLDFSNTMSAITDLPKSMMSLALNDFNTPMISMMTDQAGKMFGDLKQVFKKPIKAEVDAPETDIYAEQSAERTIEATEESNDLLTTQNGLFKDLIKAFSKDDDSVDFGLGDAIGNFLGVGSGKGFMGSFKKFFLGAFTKIISPFKKIFGKMGGKTKFLGKIFGKIGSKMGLLGKIVGKILLPLTMLYEFVKDFGKISDFLSSEEPISDKIVFLLKEISSSILAPLAAIPEMIVNGLSWIFGSDFRVDFGKDAIMKSIDDMSVWFFDNVTVPVLDFLTIDLPQIFTDFIDGITSYISDIYDSMITKKDEIVSTISDKINGIYDGITSYISDLMDMAKDVISGFVKSVRSNFADTVRSFGLDSLADMIMGSDEDEIQKESSSTSTNDKGNGVQKTPISTPTIDKDNGVQKDLSSTFITKDKQKDNYPIGKKYFEPKQIPQGMFGNAVTSIAVKKDKIKSKPVSMTNNQISSSNNYNYFKDMSTKKDSQPEFSSF